MKLTHEKFLEICKYAMSQVDPEEIEYCWYQIDKNHLYVLTDAVETQIRDAVTDWFYDHEDEGYTEDDFYESLWYDIVDVFTEGQRMLDKEKEGVNESYADDQCDHSSFNNGAVMEGLIGLLRIMDKYEDYLGAAIKEITDMYAKLGIKVISATMSNDGFMMSFDKASVMESLAKNGYTYEMWDENEDVTEYVHDDFEEFTVSKWKDAGKTVAMLFATVWQSREMRGPLTHGGGTLYKPDGDLYYTSDEGTLKVEFSPCLFEAVDDVLHALREGFTDSAITECRKYAK